MLKSTVSTNSKDRPFPKLMKNVEGDIVLFHDFECGVVVHPSKYEDCDIGDYRNDWIMSEFKDFVGSVTITEE